MPLKVTDLLRLAIVDLLLLSAPSGRNTFLQKTRTVSRRGGGVQEEKCVEDDDDEDEDDEEEEDKEWTWTECSTRTMGRKKFSTI